MMFRDLSAEEKKSFIRNAEKKFSVMDDDEIKITLCEFLSAGGVDHPCLGLPCDRCPLHDLEGV